MLKYALYCLALFWLTACVSDNTTPEAQTADVQNYLTPIPLSELKDSVLESHFPSLEGTLIATKEFKARFEAYKELVYDIYRSNPGWNGRDLTKIDYDMEMHGIPEYYLTNADKDMWVIDSMFAQDMLDSNFYNYNTGTSDNNYGHFFNNPTQTRNLFLAFAAEKETHLEKGIDKEYSKLLKFSCPNANSLSYVFWMKKQTASNGNKIRQQHYVIPPKAINNFLGYYYNTSPLIKDDKKTISVGISNKNVKDYEPFIAVYSEKIQMGSYLMFDNKTGRYSNPSFLYPPKGWSMYIVAMAESTDGQMLAGIRPFVVGDTMKYRMELQMELKPMTWDEFNAAVNALK